MSVVKINAITVPADRADELAGRFAARAGQVEQAEGFEEFHFRRSSWADFAMYQVWDEAGGSAFFLRQREEQAKTGRIIPQVNEEYGYEEHYPTGWGGNPRSRSPSW